MIKSKIQNKSKLQMSNIKTKKFCHLVFMLCAYFVLCALVFGISMAYALNIDKVKVYFLSGDYKSAISEGERLLANYGNSSHLDELYYILGLSYLKDGNYLRASDIFEIILKEFKDSSYKEEAKLGLADTYFLRANFKQAQSYYKDLLGSNPDTKLKALIFYRLSQTGFKTGDIQEAKEYLGKLKDSFTLNPELRLNRDLYNIAISSSDLFYTVQVGSFSNSTNAKNLMQKLIQDGYPAYIEEATSLDTKTIYRVRVGRSRIRQQAQELESKLSQEGYPTKIYP